MCLNMIYNDTICIISYIVEITHLLLIVLVVRKFVSVIVDFMSGKLYNSQREGEMARDR